MQMARLPGLAFMVEAEPPNSEMQEDVFEGSQKNAGALPASDRPKAQAAWLLGFSLGKERCQPFLPASYGLINSLKVTGEIPSSPLITSFH